MVPVRGEIAHEIVIADVAGENVIAAAYPKTCSGIGVANHVRTINAVRKTDIMRRHNVIAALDVSLDPGGVAVGLATGAVEIKRIVAATHDERAVIGGCAVHSFSV